MVVKNFKRSAIALDSNAFITLAGLNIENNSKRGKKLGFYQACRDIKRMAANDHVYFIITPMVMSEIGKGLTEKEEKFLKDYCFILVPKNEEEYAEKIYELSSVYSGTETMKLENAMPTRDAVIMAEAAVAGFSLLTNNTRDFMDYDRYRHEQKGQRSVDIKTINENMGYYFSSDKRRIVPAPYTSYDFLDNYRNGVFDAKPEAYKAIEDSKIKNLNQFSL